MAHMTSSRKQIYPVKLTGIIMRQYLSSDNRSIREFDRTVQGLPVAGLRWLGGQAYRKYVLYASPCKPVNLPQLQWGDSAPTPARAESFEFAWITDALNGNPILLDIKPSDVQAMTDILGMRATWETIMADHSPKFYGYGEHFNGRSYQ
jgi:hypothetical protein